MDRIKNSRLTLLICLFLAAATLAAFWPVMHYAFINCDDQAYVYENPAIQAGPELAGDCLGIHDWLRGQLASR